MAVTFFNDFLANFLADIAAGVLLALFAAGLAYLVGKYLNVFELAQQRKKERQQEIQRTIQYLNLLKDEISDLLESKIPEQREALSEARWREKGSPTLTSIWEMAERGGQLARLLNPDVLRQLVDFYDSLTYVKHRVNSLVEICWVGPQRALVHLGTQELLTKEASRSLDQVEKIGEGLAGRIDSEIGRLSKLVADLPADDEPRAP